MSAFFKCHFELSAQPFKELKDDGRARFDDRLHHQLTFGVQDGDADACLMHIESDIVCIHKGSPLGGKLPSFDNSEATTRGHPFIMRCKNYFEAKSGLNLNL